MRCRAFTLSCVRNVVFIVAGMVASIHSYALVPAERIDELANVGSLKHSVVSFKVGQIYALDRYGKISPTKKFEMAANEFIDKIDVNILYNDVKKMMANELTEADVRYLVDMSKTPLFQKYLEYFRYALTQQGYQAFVEKNTEYGLGIFQPDQEKFRLLKEDLAESQQMLRSQLVQENVHWILNLELRKFYPRAAVTYTQFQEHFKTRRKDSYDDDLDQHAFSRYFIMGSLTKAEIETFIAWNRSPAMTRYDNAFVLGIIEHLGRIEKQVRASE